MATIGDVLRALLKGTVDHGNRDELLAAVDAAHPQAVPAAAAAPVVVPAPAPAAPQG